MMLEYNILIYRLLITWHNYFRHIFYVQKLLGQPKLEYYNYYKSESRVLFAQRSEIILVILDHYYTM